MKSVLTELGDPAATKAVARAAHTAAAVASRAGGVVVQEAGGIDAAEACAHLFNEVWNKDVWQPPVPREAIRALVHAGNYLGGAYRDGVLVGACLGFFGHPDDRLLHSHLAGVVRESRGANVGYALKLHQRAWCLSGNVGHVTWTFDPLVSRNAYFNVHKLGASAVTYLADFYGPLDDAFNSAGPSDRLLASWDLASERARRACSGRPGAPSTEGAWVALGAGPQGGPVRPSTSGNDDVVLVAVPADIESMRAQDPATAREWRFALREILTGLLGAGARIVGFTRSGHYVIERASSEKETA
jgi:predicted GNAT superfamily acetyltransferase